MESLQQNPPAPAPQSRSPRLFTVTPDDLHADNDTPFPDLPAELRPQRADGTGLLTYSDIHEMNRKGGTPLLTKVAERQAEVAVGHLQRKMNIVADEFAKGEINHAQFQAIYTRYSEQRAMIERIRDHDPRSTAWRDNLPVAGGTAMLRQQLAAEVTGCAIVDHTSRKLLRRFASFAVQDNLLSPLIARLASVSDGPAFERRERTTMIEGGQWLTMIPGEFTTTIVTFSKEPAASQRALLTDLHQDFERANHRVLSQGIAVPERLVYPHTTLFGASSGV
jgi:hypothetical protein